MTLNDKYTALDGIHYLTGIQALVRLPIDQMRLDRRAGLNTGVFISGYEGSPLGGYDLALQRVSALLREHNIVAQPGVNEDLAATSILGSQILDVAGPKKVDGVVGIWYGKGPGVDRSGDILRHANLSGSPGASAAIVLAGDDHTSKSSTIPHQSDFSLMNFAIPVFYPGNAQEVLELGLAAIAASRYSGAWAGLKLVTDVCDGGATVDVSLAQRTYVGPEGYAKHTDPMLVIPHTHRLEVETNTRRLEAVKAFVRANGLDRIEGDGKIAIATAGKTYYDLMEAFRLMGVDPSSYRIGKYAMTFPIEPEFTRELARGVERLIVIEEKRSFLEMQIRELLCNDAERPLVQGKDLFPAYGELTPELIAAVMTGQALPAAAKVPWRKPNFCSGCPHNRSTLLLEGQIAGGGTGCHGMAVMLGASGRGFSYATHMGGEGAPWIGMAPFSERKHMIQNIGDGTYFHSGSLAIQACVAAKVNITFKLLYNGHVAMTGGQDAQGALPVPDLTRKLEAEGVRRIIVLVEDVERYAPMRAQFAPNAEVRDRIALPEVQRELEATPGVTVMIYDQECAAEKRRQRSRGKLAEPQKRLIIQSDVCEGCGDCVTQSNCASLQRVATPKGEKMSIHQSSCNKDYTCAFGDCPSFLTVYDEPKVVRRAAPLPPPETPAPARMVDICDHGYRILMPGIGGTGVVTINALLATAALRDGLYVTSLDQTGLAQKGGAVTSHLTLSRVPLKTAARIFDPDVVVAFDPGGVPEGARLAVKNSPIPGPFNVDATRLAEEKLASHLFVNMFLTGFAWQAGLIPISQASIEAAIRLNGVEAEGNIAAFHWGRSYYGRPAETKKADLPVLDYAAELTAYQNEAYAKQHAAFVALVPQSVRAVVAQNLYKLMAYKDEYEVARLLSRVEGRVTYNLHPPLLRAWGLKQKLELGPWFRPALQVLASLKGLRGTPFDVFGYAQHRREERATIDWYRQLILVNFSHPRLAELAALPDAIRGYDEIKSRSIAAAKQRALQICASPSTALLQVLY